MAYIYPSGPQQGALRNALIDAFPAEDNMAELLAYRWEEPKNLAAIAGSGPLKKVYFNLIKMAIAEGWLDTLILAALASRIGHPGIQTVAQELDLTALEKPREDEDGDEALQRTIDESQSTVDIALWREKLGAVEGQVCHIEVPKHNGRTGSGTGFLLGPNVLITNYHVMKAVLDHKADADKVCIRFDFKAIEENENQTVISKGTVFHLANDWNLDTSPYSEIDKKRDPKPGPPADNELDYVLMRVKGKPGKNPIGGDKAEPMAPERGWIELPDPVPALNPGMAIMIAQHPDSKPLKIVSPPGKVLEANDIGPRVRYNTNTEKGSSGSPCFDANWNLVALHHAGDPNFDEFHDPEYNQGVPFTAILALLEKRNKRNLLPA